MISAMEYCKNVFDGTHDSPKPSAAGFKLLTSKHILNNKLDKENAYFISENDYDSINKRSKVRKWDILFSMIGTVGNIYLVTEDNIDFAIKNMGVFSCEEEYEAKWLYYYLKSPYAQSYIKNYLNGAIQKFLPLNKLRDFPVPKFEENSKKNVDILWALDEKIKNNKIINNQLESLLKIIYNYWFLQFEFPDENGKPYKSSGGDMVWNDELKKEIPENWKYLRLCDIEKNIVTGKTPPTKKNDNFGGSIPFITIDDIRKGIYLSKTDTTLTEEGANSQKNKYIPENSICVSCIATVGLVAISTEDSQTNQQINSIICNNKNNIYYLVSALKQYFQFSSGAKTGNIFANMNKDDFSNIMITYPNEEVLQKYNCLVEPLYLKMRNTIIENNNLQDLRDFLLPLLMNGQIGFKD